jgi:hypothetical protein
LCHTQELGYDFQFYPLKFKTNHPILLCSRGAQPSLVDPSACALPVQPHAAAAVGPPGASGGSSDCSAAELIAARQYLATVAACPPAPFAAGLDKTAEDDFVRLRQASGGGGGGVGVSAADFHRWLTLARLLCAASGAPTVELGHWQRALALEAARRARIPDPPPPPPEAAASAGFGGAAGAAGGGGGVGVGPYTSPAAARASHAMGPPPPPPHGPPRQASGGGAKSSPAGGSGAPRPLPVNMEGDEE